MTIPTTWLWFGGAALVVYYLYTTGVVGSYVNNIKAKIIPSVGPALTGNPADMLMALAAYKKDLDTKQAELTALLNQLTPQKGP